MREIWKDIRGFEGIYQVSSLGRIKSAGRRGTVGGIVGGYLSTKKYPLVDLCSGTRLIRKNRAKKIHRLVAEAFIPNPENKPQVNHKNCNKADNRVENLEWVTGIENMQHAFKNGAFDNVIRPKRPWQKGEKAPSAILNEKQVRIIKNIFTIPNHLNLVQIGKIFDVSPEAIGLIKKGKNWSHVII